MKTSLRSAVLLTTSLLFAACAQLYTPDQVDGLMARAVTSGNELVRLQQPVEAAQVVRAAQRIAPDYPGLAEVEARLDGLAASQDLFEPTWLGSNRARRYPMDRTPLAQALLYVPDRLLDALDVVSVDLHWGFGLFAKLHATQAAQLGGGARAIGGVGTYGNRSIVGARASSSAEVALFPLDVAAERIGQFSVSGIQGSTRLASGLQRPTAEHYQELEDYWSVGFAFTAVPVGLDASFHPLQIVDFLAGFALLDPLNDDFAHTRGLSLANYDEFLLRELLRVSRSSASLASYRSSRPSDGAAFSSTSR